MFYINIHECFHFTKVRTIRECYYKIKEMCSVTRFDAFAYDDEVGNYHFKMSPQVYETIIHLESGLVLYTPKYYLKRNTVWRRYNRKRRHLLRSKMMENKTTVEQSRPTCVTELGRRVNIGTTEVANWSEAIKMLYEKSATRVWYIDEDPDHIRPPIVRVVTSEMAKRYRAQMLKKTNNMNVKFAYVRMYKNRKQPQQQQRQQTPTVVTTTDKPTKTYYRSHIISEQRMRCFRSHLKYLHYLKGHSREAFTRFIHFLYVDLNLKFSYVKAIFTTTRSHLKSTLSPHEIAASEILSGVIEIDFYRIKEYIMNSLTGEVLSKRIKSDETPLVFDPEQTKKMISHVTKILIEGNIDSKPHANKYLVSLLILLTYLTGARARIDIRDFISLEHLHELFRDRQTSIITKDTRLAKLILPESSTISTEFLNKVESKINIILGSVNRSTQVFKTLSNNILVRYMNIIYKESQSGGNISDGYSTQDSFAVRPHGVSYHSFRRAFIASACEKLDVSLVQKLVNHTSVRTTIRYRDSNQTNKQYMSQQVSKVFEISQDG